MADWFDDIVGQEETCPTEADAASLLAVLEALRLVAYRKVWYFWLPTRPKTTEQNRHRVLMMRTEMKAGAQGWRARIREGIYRAAEVDVAMEHQDWANDICNTLERRDGLGAPWASQDEVLLRAEVLRLGESRDRSNQASVSTSGTESATEATLQAQGAERAVTATTSKPTPRNALPDR